MKFTPAIAIVLLTLFCLPCDSEAQFRLKFPSGGGGGSGGQLFGGQQGGQIVRGFGRVQDQIRNEFQNQRGLPGGQQGGQFFQGVGRVVKDQIQNELQNQRGRIQDKINQVIGGEHVILPVPDPGRPQLPSPVDRPIVTPLPFPFPGPSPCPDPIDNPGGGGCRIVPQPYLPITEPLPPEPYEPVAPEPTEPAEPAAPLPQIESGQVVTLEDATFGEDVGAVVVKIDALILTADLLEWTDTLVKARMPRLPMAVAAEAQVVVLNAEGEIAEVVAIELLPSTQPEVTETAAEEEVELPVVYLGQEVAIDGEFGANQGSVELHIGQLVLTAQIIEWSNEQTTVQIPELNLEQPTAGAIVISSSEGELVEQVEVALHPAVAGEEVVVSDK